MLTREHVMEQGDHIAGTDLNRDTGDRVRFARPPEFRRGTAMHYRIYLLGLDNHIARPGHDVQCSSDLEAFAEIAPLVENFTAADLWCGTRLVGRWTPMGIEVAAGEWAGVEAAVA
jgi:hypothetical protein